MAVLYKFGIQHHVGADALSDFFKMIRINTLMATPNCSTYGHPNCSRQDGHIGDFFGRR